MSDTTNNINISSSESNSFSSSTSIIESYIINIGTQVDEKSKKKAETALNSIKNNLLRISKLVIEGFAAVVGVGTSVVYGVHKIAAAFDELYYAAQRSGTSVAAMKSLGYAAEQLGVSGKDAQESLSNIARFMRNNAAGEGILNGLGIGTREANGELRDTKDILIDVLNRLQHMPQFQANRISEMLGINENLRLTDLKQMSGFMEEATQTAKEFGLSLDDVSVQANQFETVIRRLGLYLDIIKAKVLQNLSDPLKTQMKEVVTYFQDHHTEIIHGISVIAEAIIDITGVIAKAVIGIAILSGKLFDFFSDLKKNHPVLLTLIKAITALVVVIGAIELAPLAALAAVITAIGTAIGYLSYQWDALKNHIKTGFNDALIEFLKDQSVILSLLTHPIDFLRKYRETGKFWESGNLKFTVKEDFKPKEDNTRGNRNNNPGNIKFSPWERQFGAIGAEENGPFARFGSMEQGLSALAFLLKRYSGRGLNTVQSIISTYAPGNENNTSAYINDVAKNMGVSSTSALDLTNPATLDAMMKAISRHEGTYNPSVDAAIDKVSGVTVTQNNTFHIDGSKDPQATATAVSNKLGASADLRNMKPVVR
jgi:hypothetical protein